MGIVLTNNAKFTPYSFEDMLKPLAMATQEYNAIEEGIAELGTKADLMRMYANELPDSKVANMYNTYANDLDKQAEDLAKYGLNPASRSSLLGLKRRYSTEITPIKTAVEYRKKVAEEQRKLAAANPNVMFTLDFSNMDLDKLIDNPELGYSSVSGDDLYKKGAAIAEAASRRIIETNPTLGGQYYAVKEGYGEEAARQFLLNSANIKEINDALEGVFKEAGADKLSYRDLQRAREFLKSGAVSGMTYKETLRDNKNVLTPYQKAQLKAQGLKDDGSVDPDSPIWTMKGYVKDKDGNLREPGKVYNTKDGLVRVTPSGDLIKLQSDSTSTSVGGNYTLTFEDATLGKYKKEGTSIGIGPSNKPDLKGTKYEIIGNSKEALADKAYYINMITSAINSSNAIVLLNKGADWGHRSFFKIGKYGSDVPANIFNDFGDDIKFDEAGNIDFKLNQPLEIFEINETIKQKDYGDVPYDLSKFYLIKVPSSSGTVYVGVPKIPTTIPSSGTSSSASSSGGYGGDW